MIFMPISPAVDHMPPVSAIVCPATAYPTPFVSMVGADAHILEYPFSQSTRERVFAKYPFFIVL